MLCEFAFKFIRSNSIWNHTGLNTVVVNPFELRCQNQPINLQIYDIIFVLSVGFCSVFFFFFHDEAEGIPEAGVEGTVLRKPVINWPRGSLSLLWKQSHERNVWKARVHGSCVSVATTWGGCTRRMETSQISVFHGIEDDRDWHWHLLRASEAAQNSWQCSGLHVASYVLVLSTAGLDFPVASC